MSRDRDRGPRDPATLGALPDDALIFAAEVVQLVACSIRTFYQRRGSRTFPIPEVFPRIDNRPRFRLGTVRAYVRGQAQAPITSTPA